MSECTHARTRVIDSRSLLTPRMKSYHLRAFSPGEFLPVRRRWECLHCGHRFTTYEIQARDYENIEQAIVDSMKEKIIDMLENEIGLNQGVIYD